MTGVFTAVFVLTVSCFGDCAGIQEVQRLETSSQQTCLFIKDAVQREFWPNRQIVADCVGEAREVKAPARLSR